MAAHLAEQVDSRRHYEQGRRQAPAWLKGESWNLAATIRAGAMPVRGKSAPLAFVDTHILLYAHDRSAGDKQVIEVPLY